jgi:hypothetical protein
MFSFSVNLIENAVVLSGPFIRQGASTSSQPIARISRWGDDLYKNLNLLSLGKAQVFVEFNGFAMNDAMCGLAHSKGLLLVVIISAAARNECFIILGSWL